MQQQVSGQIEHENAAREVVPPARPSHVRRSSWPPQGGDVDQSLPVDVDIGWPLNVIPDLKQRARQAEDLDAVILTVGHKDAVIGDPDAVRDVELTRPAPELAPGLDQLSGWREAMDRAFP